MHRPRPHFLYRTAIAVAVMFVIVALSPATPLAAPGAQGNAESLEHVQKAMALLMGEEPRPEKALEELDRAIAADVNNAGAYFYRGMAYGQLQRLPDALASFVLAAELAPGYADAHVWACRISFGLGDFDTSWEQAILAAQAGVDMSQAFIELRGQGGEPDDLERQLRAPRVALGGIDTESVAGRDGIMDNAVGSLNTGSTGVDSRSADTDTNPLAGTFVGPTGGTARLAEAQADLYEVRRTFGQLLQESREFAMVQQSELADYVLFLKIDQLGDGRPRELVGFVKFFEGENEVYSRPLRLRDIESKADLRTEITRYVTFMENWLAEERR